MTELPGTGVAAGVVADVAAEVAAEVAAGVAAGQCRWCRRRLPERRGPGRPREFCGGACRQQDYLRRQRASEAGLAEHELVVTRHELDDLHDRLYMLEAAVEDVERDLAGSPSAQEYREAVDWLLEAARPLLRSRIGDRS